MAFLDQKWVMEQWDKWREYIANGGKASWPRDAFENIISRYEEEIEELKSTALRGGSGWICPKCGYVWAWYVVGCHNCNQPKVYTSSLPTKE